MRALQISRDVKLPLDAVTQTFAVLGKRGSGKALALDTLLATPTGWTTMAAVRVGDVLFDERGEPCCVTYVAPVQIGNECYRVLFSDDSSIVADAEHLWLAETLASRRSEALRRLKAKRGAAEGRLGRWQCQRRTFPEIATTAHIASHLRVPIGSSGRQDTNFSIHNCAPIRCDDADLPIDPYVLGVWLGDGSTASSYVTSADPDLLVAVGAEGYVVGPPVFQPSNARLYRVGSKDSGRCLHRELRLNGLLGNKRVPVVYLRASQRQREALLAGLMDTYGGATDCNECEFYSTNEWLADAAAELVASLGWRATKRVKEAKLYGKPCGPVFTIAFRPTRQVFRLKRKADRLKFGGPQESRQTRRMIVAADRVPSVPVRCIAVDSPSRLFLAGPSMIPTHNTNTASVLFEQFVKAGQPAVYVDPIGVTWGLRHSRDGKSAGLPVIILGGEHADVPLEETGGVVIADFVIEHRQPVVLDLGLFSKGAQRRFMVDFAERLYHKNREALHVMLDECDAWVPQRAEHGAERLSGAINDLVRKGRARGIGVTLISQRAAVISKDVLTQIETLIAHRMTAPHDRDAIEKWIEHNADGGDEVLSSLQILEDGEAWVWSPSWLKLCARTRMNLRETFDSSATPKAGARVAKPKHAAEVDLGALREQLAATIEKAKADDPKELRRQIAALEKQLKAAPTAPAKPSKPVEVPVLTKEQVRQLTSIRGDLAKVGGGLVQLDKRLEALTGVYQDHRRGVQEISARVLKMADAVDAALVARPMPFAAPVPARAVVPALAQRHRSLAVAPPSPNDDTNGALPKGERAVLTAIAQAGPNGATRDQISALTGYKRQTRDDYISRLARKGFVSVPNMGGPVFATQEGLDALGPSFEPLPTGAELIDHWRSRLPKGECAIFNVLVEAWPEGLTRESIGEATGFKRQTRDDYISRLVRKKIVEKPHLGAPVKASEALMAHAR